MKLTGKMVCYFLVVVIVSTVGFGFIIEDSMGTKADVEKVAAEDLPKFIMVSEILENNLNQVANLRGYIITRNEQLLKNYQDLHEANLKLEQDLFAAAKTDEGRKMIQEMIDYRVQYAKTIDQEVIPLFKAGRTEEGIVAVGRAGAYVNQVLEAGKVLEERYRGAAHQSLAGAVASADHTINISIMAAVISIILSMAVAVFSSRNIANQVRQLADLAHEVANGDLTDHYRGKISKDEIGELASSLNTMVQNLKQIVITIGSQSQTLAASSEELTASADQSAQATQQVAGSVTEVAAGTEKQLDSVKTANSVVENMVAELEEVASNVSMVADKAVQTAEMATNGGKSATKAIEQMHEVEKTVSESAKVVAHLGERSKEIGQIVDTISGIAGQTNLLALNAAIEAARAGEQGRGFAVVAEEVRKLAEQSQEASHRIAELIGEIQLETNHAVAAMENGTREVKIGAEVVNETGVSFEEIIALVQQVSGQMNGIAKVVQSVAQGSERIVASVQDISQLSNAAASEIETVSSATEEQSASMQQIAAASQNLSKLAQDMQATVERFRV